MSKRTVHTPFHAGELVSERTAAGLMHSLRSGRARRPKTPAPATSAGLADRPDPPSPTGEADPAPVVSRRADRLRASAARSEHRLGARGDHDLIIGRGI